MSKILSRPWARDLLVGLVLLTAALALVVWPQQSMEAAKTGLQLCYNVIIPSLFPFFVLSSLVVELGLAGYLGRALEKLMRPLFRVPGACASALVLGFIGGYPVGARTAIELYEKGLCSKTETERLLAFCNNSGPAFILGVVGAGVFGSSKAGALLYVVHIAASVCVGILFRFYKYKEGGRDEAARVPIHTQRLSTAFTDSVKNSFLSILNICAFVIFFTVVIRMLSTSGALGALAGALSALLSPLGMSEAWGERLLTGIMEVSSGVWSLSGEGSLAGRMSMAAFMLGWAGISVHCQVLSFMGGSGLSVRTYVAGKLLHGGLSALFVGLILTGRTTALALPAAVLLTFFAVTAGMVRKSSGKRRKSVV